jgi:HAD superfamily hydrolase (TIGR01509 family)
MSKTLYGIIRSEKAETAIALMVLKAVLFDFNGVIINDEPIHKTLIEQILVDENLRPNPDEYWDICLGRSDRACLRELLTRRGRVVTDEYLNQLVNRKAEIYRHKLQTLEKLPIFPGVDDLIYHCRGAQLVMGIVSGAVRSEIELVLERSGLSPHFSVIVPGDEIQSSKPDPEGYLLAVEQLNQQKPELRLQPNECLVLEDSFPGIEAAKRAGMQVVGVANTYPFHMMQRQANWAVDYLTEVELDRIRHRFAGQPPIPVNS